MTCTPLHDNALIPTGRAGFETRAHLLPSGGGWSWDELNTLVGLWCAIGMYRALGDDTEVAAVAGQIAGFFGASGSEAVVEAVLAFDPLSGESFEQVLREVA